MVGLTQVSAYEELRLTHLEDYRYSSPKVLSRDEFGFLWIGTADGLLRFDGYQYKKFVPIKGDNKSISGRNIRDILYDSSSRLWIGTTSGLNIYSYKTNTFDKVEISGNEKDFVFDIFETQDKSLWVGTSTGLYRLDIQNSKPIKYESFVDSNNQISKFMRSINSKKESAWFRGAVLHEIKSSGNKTGNRVSNFNLRLTLDPAEAQKDMPSQKNKVVKNGR